MDTQIIVVFCLCADMLKSLHYYEDRQCRMSDAEVMTTAIVAMLYFKGNFCLASQYSFEHHNIPNCFMSEPVRQISILEMKSLHKKQES